MLRPMFSLSHRQIKHSPKPFGAKAEELRSARTKPQRLDSSSIKLVRKPKVQPFKPPEDSVVREVAIQVAKTKRYSKRVTHFRKVLAFYCKIAMGFSDKQRHQVEEFVYIQLKRIVEGWKETHAFTKAPLLKQELEQVAGSIFKEVEDNLLLLAAKGRRLKQESDYGYKYVLCSIGLKTSQQCVITLREFDDSRESEIMSLQSSARFNRWVQKHFHRRARQLRREEDVAKSKDTKKMLKRQKEARRERKACSNIRPSVPAMRH